MADTSRIASAVRACLMSLIGSAVGVGGIALYLRWRLGEDMTITVCLALMFWGAISVLDDAGRKAIRAWRGGRDDG